MTVEFVDYGQGRDTGVSQTDDVSLGLALPAENTSGQYGVVTVDLTGTSFLMPAPPGAYQVRRKMPDPDTYVPTEQKRTVGRPRIVIRGQDVTFFRGVPAQLQDWSSVDPGGDAACTIWFPQISWLDRPTHGDLTWMMPSAPVTLYVGSIKVWEGEVGPWQLDTGKDGWTVQCQGVLFETDRSVWPPKIWLETKDLGDYVADVFDGVPSRGYGACNRPATGIEVRKRGAWGKRTEMWQNLLSTAWNDAGTRKWTVTNRNRAPYLYLRDDAAQDHVVSVGAPGVTVNLDHDHSQWPNVIYGEGTREDGGHWRNTKFPNMAAGDAPIYPLTSPARFLPGDGQTGFGPFADEMRRHGYAMHSVDTYDSRDRAEVRDFQTRADITLTADDGVGPQTWATLFQPAANGADLTGAFYMPLAYWTQVEPNSYGADGAVIGANTGFVPDRMRVEEYHNYGEGFTLRQGKTFAAVEIAPQKIYEPVWAGTVTLRSDPEGHSRFTIRAGHNLFVRYLIPPYKHWGPDSSGGAQDGLLLHITEARHNLDETTLQVTYRQVDKMTLDAIVNRKRENADPGRRPNYQRRRGQQTRDEIVIFDAEAGAGVMPAHVLYPGIWTVLRIPAGQVGNIVKTHWWTTSPVSKFALGFFSAPVTANQIRDLVGNPFVDPGVAGHTSPWTVQSDALLDIGLLAAWGGPDQAAGYYPGAESDGGPVTGVLKDFQTWPYETLYPPWLWVAEYAPSGSTIRGRIFQSSEL